MARSTVSAAPVPLLINRNFALLWSGQAISILGDLIFTTTITIWVGIYLAHGQPWAALAVSGILVAAGVPPLLLAPMAGVLADRWDSRRLMVTMDALRALAILGLLILSFVGSRAWSPLEQWIVVCGVVLLVSCGEQFFRPAMTKLIGDLVPEPLQPRAIGLGQVSLSLAAIAGPALASVVLFAAGLQWALVFDALSFAISCWSVLAIQSPRDLPHAAATAEGSLGSEFRAGLRFFFGNSSLRALIIALVAALLAAGAFQALDLFFVTKNLHTPPAYYGLLETAQGLGMLIGAVVATAVTARAGITRIIWTSLFAVGALALVYARLTSFFPAAILLFVLGIPLAAITVACDPLILRVTPRHLIGRVIAIITPITTLAGMVGMALAGYLDSTVLHGFRADILGQAVGPIDTIFTAAGLLVLLGGWCAFVGLRGQDSPAPAASEYVARAVSQEDDRAIVMR